MKKFVVNGRVFYTVGMNKKEIKEEKEMLKKDLSNYVSIGEAIKIFGLSKSEFKKYEKQGKFSASYLTTGNHKRYDINQLKKILNK